MKLPNQRELWCQINHWSDSVAMIDRNDAAQHPVCSGWPCANWSLLWLFVLWQVAELLRALSTVHHYKKKVAQRAHHAKHKEFLQQKEKDEEAKMKRMKDARKKLYRIMGQKDQKKQRSSLKGTPQDDWLFRATRTLSHPCRLELIFA